MVCGEGGVRSAGRCVMGTLDMLGSKFLSILILMGIWLGADGGDICCGVTPFRRWGGDLSTLMEYWCRSNDPAANTSAAIRRE